MSPRIGRELHRVFKVIGLKEGEQADIQASRTAAEFQVGRVALVDDLRKTLTKVKAGDIVQVNCAVTAQLLKRNVHVECNEELYRFGRPTFKTIYTHGELLFAPLTWECYEDLDLAALDYLYRVYIIDEVIR